MRKEGSKLRTITLEELPQEDEQGKRLTSSAVLPCRARTRSARQDQTWGSGCRGGYLEGCI